MRVFRTLLKRPLVTLGVTIVVAVILVALLAPVLSPYPDDALGKAVHMSEKLRPPSTQHLFGTDELGRDLLSRVIYGSRLSLYIGGTVVVLTAVIGITAGIIAGFFGGKIDTLIMRTADIFLSIPYILLVIVIATVLSRSITNLIIAIALPWWPWYARVARGEVLRIRGSTFVEASFATGASNRHVLLGHILPNIVPVLIVQASLQVGRAILAAAAMGFIGVGVQPPDVEWGVLVASGRKLIPTYWWVSTFPGLTIFVTSLGFNLVGDALRDILDPRRVIR